MAGLTQQGSNQNIASLPRQQKLGSGTSNTFSNNNSTLELNTEAPKTTSDAPEGYAQLNTGTYGTLSKTRDENSLDQDFNLDPSTQSKKLTRAYQMQLHEKKIQKGKQVLAKAFNGKREGYTNSDPVILYLEEERSIASEDVLSIKLSRKWLYILAFLVFGAIAYLYSNKN